MGQALLHAAHQFWPIPLLSSRQEAGQYWTGGKAIAHIGGPLRTGLFVAELTAPDSLGLGHHDPEYIEHDLCQCFGPQIIGMALVDDLPFEEIRPQVWVLQKQAADLQG